MGYFRAVKGLLGLAMLTLLAGCSITSGARLAQEAAPMDCRNLRGVPIHCPVSVKEAVNEQP